MSRSVNASRHNNTMIYSLVLVRSRIIHAANAVGTVYMDESLPTIKRLASD